MGCTEGNAFILLSGGLQRSKQESARNTKYSKDRFHWRRSQVQILLTNEDPVFEVMGMRAILESITGIIHVDLSRYLDGLHGSLRMGIHGPPPYLTQGGSRGRLRAR